ncbi:MAG TPA: TetR family transcriptional regulator C-terminal domain-containing protein [Solirubrobacterales bacterium]|jgi:AcrR family transcriptional regulator|nr:TetR family transcriptional regulator C-terminal domain-containing protein [Solirubrobacterales bacterium]
MPKKVDHDARREELVLAAWRVIAANGIDEVTIRDIARESGYSSGVLAHYFKNKDDLLAHALQLSHTRIRKRYDAEVEETPGAAEALKAILLDNLPMDEQREMETRIEMSFWARALRNEELHEIQRKESETLRALLRELVEKAQKDKAIAKKHDREEILELLGAVIDGISLHALLYPDRLPAKRQAAVMEFALALLK